MKKTKQKTKNSFNIIGTIVVIVFLLMLCFVSKFPWNSKDLDNSNEFFDADIKLDCVNEVYDGSEIEPGVTVKLDGEILEQEKDYRVTYYHNTMPGVAYAMISGTGDYEGDTFVTFSILLNDEVCDDPSNERLVRYIYSWYSIMFEDRKATRDEIIYWVNQIRSNTFSSQELMDNMFSSGNDDIYEYKNNELVNRVYRAFLNRTPDSEGYSMWCEMLENEEIERIVFIHNIVGSPEFIENIISYTTDDSET